MSKRTIRRVLVVDDDPADLESARFFMPDLEVLLEAEGCNVLQRIRTEKPDLVILDLILGAFDATSLTITAAIKAEQPELPVVMLSSALDVRMASILARRCHADLFLPKQGRRTFEELLAFVEEGIEPDPWDAGTGPTRESRRAFARRLLARSGGNKAKAARLANVSWATVNRWLGEDDDAGAAGGVDSPDRRSFDGPTDQPRQRRALGRGARLRVARPRRNACTSLAS